LSSNPDDLAILDTADHDIQGAGIKQQKRDFIMFIIALPLLMLMFTFCVISLYAIDWAHKLSGRVKHAKNKEKKS
jgi:hypothetical protein